MYLLDTNVVSELRKAKSGKTDKNVIVWANSVAATSLFLSSITLLELEMGVLAKERSDAVQGKVLRHWLENQAFPSFEGRILAVDEMVARQCAKLHIPDPRSDRDALIAATALVHSLVVATRNIKDFEGTGVGLLNPWD